MVGFVESRIHKWWWDDQPKKREFRPCHICQIWGFLSLIFGCGSHTRKASLWTIANHLPRPTRICVASKQYYLRLWFWSDWPLKSHPRYSSIWSCSQKFRQTMSKHCTKLGEMKPIQLSIWQLDIFHCEKKRKNDPLSNHHGFSQNCHNCTATSVGTSRKLRDCLDDFSDGPNSTAPFQHQEVVGSFRRSTSANLGEHWYVSSSFLLVVVSRCFTSSYKKVSKKFKSMESCLALKLAPTL